MPQQQVPPMSAQTAAQSLPLLPGACLRCCDGANRGDPLSFAEELELDDSYELTGASAPQMMRFLAGPEMALKVAPESPLGRAGAPLHLDSALTFMSRDGATQEVLLLVELDAEGAARETYLLPLVPLRPRTAYRLVGIDRVGARQHFARLACTSFTRGTRITLATGAQCPVEDLRPGDRVLTRDDGVQPLRWIGQSTLRAVGDLAPIRIRAGTLNNLGDLVVSPEHRLFVYQRQDRVGAGRAELLVRARHLVNGASVLRQEGGFVDYFQLLFDAHQIIYAEGIAAETMLLDARTREILPEELAERLGPVIPGHSDRPHAHLEISEGLVDRPDAADLLRRASTR